MKHTHATRSHPAHRTTHHSTKTEATKPPHPNPRQTSSTQQRATPHQATPDAHQTNPPLPLPSRQRHLTKQLIAPPPRRTQPLKHRTILHTTLTKTVIQIINHDRLSTPGGHASTSDTTPSTPPHPQPHPQEQAHHWHDKPTTPPHPNHPTPPPDENKYSTPAGPPHPPHQQKPAPEPHPAHRNNNGASKTNSCSSAAPGLLSSMQRQLQERGARQQHRPQHSVIGEPRMRLQRQPTREQPPLATRHSTAAPNNG